MAMNIGHFSLSKQQEPARSIVQKKWPPYFDRWPFIIVICSLGIISLAFVDRNPPVRSIFRWIIIPVVIRV